MKALRAPLLAILLAAELAVASKVRQGRGEALAADAALDEQMFTGLRELQRQPIGLLLTDSDEEELDEQEAQEEPRADSLTSVAPGVWALLGPFQYTEYGVDPLRAFGGIQGVADRAPQAFWSALRDRAKIFDHVLSHAPNYTEALTLLPASLVAANMSKNVSRMPADAQVGIEAFPTETGPAGQTLWGFAYADSGGRSVGVNWTNTAHEAGWDISLFAAGTAHGGGWAIGEINLENKTTVLAQCSNTFWVGSESASRLPDIYKEHRSVHVLHLPRGKTRIYVNAFEPGFWCHFLVDTAAARQLLTTVPDNSNGTSPFIVMKDSAVSEVVSSKLVSPFLGIPVLNSAAKPLLLEDAEIIDGPENLKVSIHANQPLIRAGQVMIVRLLLEHEGDINCTRQSNTSKPVLNFTVALVPEGDRAPAVARVVTRCKDSPARGYLVAFPDFDGSIQRLWAAPPNISRFATKQCPPAGCPVMLSLHGAQVSLGPVWGRSYEYSGPNATAGKGFPYPAWLVQPTNRWHWGTDWEGPGHDNALAAVNFVKTFLPGAPGTGTLEEKRKTYGLDDRRVLVTGHSMGGHGCLVFATHYPDVLIGAACAAGWASMNSYSGDTSSKLLDSARRGLLEEPRYEHAADFLSANVEGVPMLAIYGSKDDNVPPTEPRGMVRLVKSAGGSNRSSVESVELPGAGHWFGQGVPPMAKWLEERFAGSEGGQSLPMPGLPDTFEFTVTNPVTYGTRGSLQVLQQQDASKPARVFVQRCPKAASGTLASSPVCDDALKQLEAAGEKLSQVDVSLEPDLVWHVDTFNVRRLALREQMPGRPWPAALRVDGALFTAKQLAMTGGCANLCRMKGSVATWKICGVDDAGCNWEWFQRGGPRGSTGPIQMALRQAPVCIAHGSGPGQFEQALMLSQKLYFVSRYATPVVDASAVVKANTTLPAECAQANLILIGPPSENTWTEKFKCAFPYLRFSNLPADFPGGRGFSLDGHAYSADGTGLLAVGTLPNFHVALLVHGIDAEGLGRAATAVPVTSGKHGADFMVFGPDYGWKGEGGILAAGYLDPLWQISSSSWSEPEHSSQPLKGRPQVDPGPDPACSFQIATLEQSDAEFADFGGSFSPQSRAKQGSGRWNVMMIVCMLVAWLVA